MKYLLDTNVLLWTAIQPRRLSNHAVTLLNDPANTLVLSAASLWEIAIKHALRRPDFDVDPRVLLRGARDNGYEELTVTAEHAVAVSELPPIHADPFDRLLVAQAVVEGIMLLTSDTVVARYPGPIRKL